MVDITPELIEGTGWPTVVVLVLLIIGVVAYAGPRGKIQRYGYSFWTLILGFLILLLGITILWAAF